MKFAWILLILSTQAVAKYTDSFIVKVGDRSIRVSAPKKRLDIVSVVVENETLDKITSQVKTGSRVLKRFVLNPQGKEVIQVDMRNVSSLYYVPIAPPFQAVELKFSQRDYEIPEKE